jgi:hypothetical protein
MIKMNKKFFTGGLGGYFPFFTGKILGLEIFISKGF